MNLSDAIYTSKIESFELTEEQKQGLYELVSNRCRNKTKAKLQRIIFNLPLSCWPTAGIFHRVDIDDPHGVSYCAGQSYPDEIRTVRQVLLGEI